MIELQNIKLVLKLVDFFYDINLSLSDGVGLLEPSRTPLRLNYYCMVAFDLSQQILNLKEFHCLLYVAPHNRYFNNALVHIIWALTISLGNVDGILDLSPDSKPKALLTLVLLKSLR